MEDIEVFMSKLREYKESLENEIKQVSQSDERDTLEEELGQLKARESEIKERIKEIKQESKDKSLKVLSIARKLKAIRQLL